jgi:hypothetical protein
LEEEEEGEEGRALEEGEVGARGHGRYAVRGHVGLAAAAASVWGFVSVCVCMAHVSLARPCVCVCVCVPVWRDTLCARAPCTREAGSSAVKWVIVLRRAVERRLSGLSGGWAAVARRLGGGGGRGTAARAAPAL